MRLRIMMKMHGLSDGVYWLVTFGWYLILSIVYFVLLIVFGSGIGLKFFTLNSYGARRNLACSRCWRGALNLNVALRWWRGLFLRLRKS